MRALIVKEFRELARDHRTAAMLLVLPILLLIIFGYAANFSVDRVSATVVGADAQQLADDLDALPGARDDIDIVAIAPDSTAEDAEQILRDRKSDVVIAATDAPSDDPLSERMRVTVDGSQLFSAQSATRIFIKLYATDAQDRVADIQRQVDEARAKATTASADMEQFATELQAYAQSLPQAIATGNPPPAPPTPPADTAMPELPEITPPTLDIDDAVTVAFNPDLKTSWVMVPGLIGLILTFIGTIITSIGLVREREAGTLEQLAVMPLRPSAIIMGKIVPYFILALIDMCLVTALGVWLFGVPFRGNVAAFALAAVIFLFVVLGLGVLISTVSQTTGQAIQLAIMTVLPQVLLSGLIFPLNAMAAGVRWIGYLLPLTWFNQIAQGILLRGAPVTSLGLPFLILTVMAVVIFGAATLRMRHSLTHGGAR